MRVLLVSMPFGSSGVPSLGVGILKARLLELGVRCDALYLSVAFAELLGPSAYTRLAEKLPRELLAGEWVFTECLYGKGGDPGAGYVDDVFARAGLTGAADRDAVLAARAAAPAFIADAVREVSWNEYEVVGFTSSFAQNIASLALARAVKELHPGMVVLFGGANWQWPMGEELLRRFPFVDVGFSGEADETLPVVLECLSRGDHAALGGIPGVAFREHGRVRSTGTAPPVTDLDTLPIPDHSDFFAAASEASWVGAGLPEVSMESSRGCWWAQARRCGFCALNASGRVYRTKSPARIVAEMRELAGRWEVRRLCLVDNLVSPSFLRDVLPVLARDPLPVPIFLEVRTDLTKEQVRLLGRLGAQIQPGIESLSDRVLGLMGKGADALENIRLLKWCRTYGVIPFWNMLYGVPGEVDADYEQVLEFLPSLTFLRPPQVCAGVRLDRFSPFFERPVEHGFERIVPLTAYRYLYPFDSRSLARIAGAFDFCCDPPVVSGSTAAQLRDAVDVWRMTYSHSSPRIVERSGGGFAVRDERPGAGAKVIELDAVDQLLYSACEDIGQRSRIGSTVEEAFPELGVTPREIDRRLASLVEKRLMVGMGDRYLSLALPAESGWRYAVGATDSSSASAATAPKDPKIARASESAALP